jgi:hypothetical protein
MVKFFVGSPALRLWLGRQQRLLHSLRSRRPDVVISGRRDLLKTSDSSSTAVYGKQRRFLYSPMFPQRAIPDLPEETGDSTKKSQTGSKKVDFLADHGGKVFLVCMAAVAALLYTYVKSNSLKTKLEDALADERGVDPDEVNEVRTVNPKFSRLIFDVLSEGCYRKFTTKSCTYPEFCEFINAKLKDECGGLSVKHGHALDRMVLTECMKQADLEMNPTETKLFDKTDTDNVDGSISSLYPLATEKFKLQAFPLTYFLVALSIVMHEKAELRADSLFRVAVLNEVGEGDVNLEANVTCSRTTATNIVTQLCRTWQVPLRLRY